MNVSESGHGPDDLFFGAIIDSYLGNPRFLRRNWLAVELEETLRNADCRFLLMTAAPGAGKSAFIAQIAHDHPNWPVYFIRRDQRAAFGAVGAHSFLMRIGYQLAALYPELFTPEKVKLVVEQRIGVVDESGVAVGAEVERVIASPFYQQTVRIRQQVERNKGAVVGLRVGEWVVDPSLIPLSDLQNLALIDPATSLLALRPEEKIVILVDALDELRYHHADQTLLQWLTNCPQLPRNIRFVLTSRPPDQALIAFSEKQRPFVQTLTLGARADLVKKDLELYVGRLVTEPVVAVSLEQMGQESGEFSFRAIAKANDNIGYLDALARGIDQTIGSGNEAALVELLSLHSLPDHLEGLYAFFLRQVRAAVDRQSVEIDDAGEVHYAPAWPAVYKRALGALAVAREPLTLGQIKSLGGVAANEDYLSEALNQLLQFLSVVNGHHRFYHASVGEFLTAQETRENPETADLYVDPVRWHGQIANHYWKAGQGDWQSCDEYGLNHLATHLFESRRHDRLQNLISKAWMDARYAGGGYVYQGFLNDVDLAWQTELAKKDCDAIILARLQMARLVVTQHASLYTDIDLKTLVWLGREQEALAHARLRRMPNERFDGLFAVYCAIEELSGCDLRLYSEVLRLANTLPAEGQRAAALKKFPAIQDDSNDFDPDGYKELLIDALKSGQQMSLLSQAEPLVALAERIGSAGRSALLEEVVHSAMPAIRESGFPEQRAESLSRLAAALTASGAIAQAEKIWEEAEAIIANWGNNHLHILAMATADLTQRLYGNGLGEKAQQIAIRIDEKIRRQYQDLDVDDDQLPEAWAWLGAMWIHLDKQERGEEIFSDLDNLLSKLVKDKRWESVAPYFAKERIREAMLRACRFGQARKYGTWLGNEAAILVAQAQAAISGVETSAKQILAEATRAVLEMPRTPDYKQKEWVKTFNQLLQALGRAGQLARPDWSPFYKDDGEALSIQACWTARAGGKEQAEKLLTMALSANSAIDRGLWNDTFQRIAQALARAGDLRSARSVIERIDETPQRLAALVELGKGFARVNLHSEADTCFEESCALVLKLGENSAAPGLSDIAFQSVIESGRQRLIEDLLSNSSEPERDLIPRPFFRVLLRTGNFEKARALIEQEKDRIYLGDYSAQVLAEALISAKQPAEAEALIESRGSVPSINRILIGANPIRQNPIRLHDNCYLSSSWGKTLARLAVCFAQLQEYTRCSRIIDALRESIDALGNRHSRTQIISDLGWALALIGHEEEAAEVFQQAEDSLKIVKGSGDRKWWAYLLEALASSGSVSRTVALSERIMKAVDSSDDGQNGILQDCAIACGKGGYFELAHKFIDRMPGSHWKRGAFRELSHDAVQGGELTFAVQLAFAWPGWMEYRHWMEMLTRLAEALVDAERFDDLRSLIPLAKEARLRHGLLARLAAGLARAKQISKAFDAIESTDLEHAMIFLADSSVAFDQIKPGLSLDVLEEAAGVAGWARADWRKIREILAEPGVAPNDKAEIEPL
jgi:hypothetical protein